MNGVHRDLYYALGKLIDSARLVPNHQDGGIVVLVDPEIYNLIEDIYDDLGKKPNRKDATYEPLESQFPDPAE